jgi:hypothetical protein
MNAKMTLDEEGLLMAEFDRVFSRETPESIRWAFQVWRDRSPFFPALSEVRTLIAEWHRSRREAAEAEASRREKVAIEKARKEGKLMEFAEVVKHLQEITAAHPEPEHLKRHREFNLRMQRVAPAVGTLHMSEEEIRARREKERAELRRYQEDFS